MLRLRIKNVLECKEWYILINYYDGSGCRSVLGLVFEPNRNAHAVRLYNCYLTCCKAGLVTVFFILPVNNIVEQY